MGKDWRTVGEVVVLGLWWLLVVAVAMLVFTIIAVSSTGCSSAPEGEALYPGDSPTQIPKDAGLERDHRESMRVVECPTCGKWNPVEFAGYCGECGR